MAGADQASADGVDAVSYTHLDVYKRQIANRLIGRVTGVRITDNGCSLKAFRASLIKGIPLYSEMHRFIPAMASIAGPRIAEIKVRHHARQFGRSKYGLSRVYKVLLLSLIHI